LKICIVEKEWHRQGASFETRREAALLRMRKNLYGRKNNLMLRRPRSG
jgi:hypothetical protein